MRMEVVTILLLYILVALPNLIADLGAFFIALLIEKRTRIYYPRRWQAVLLALSSYLFLQVLIFYAVSQFSYATYLATESMSVIYEMLVPTTSQFTRILYPGLLVLLFVVTVLRKRDASPAQETPSALVAPPTMSRVPAIVLVFVAMLGVALPGYLFLDAVQDQMQYDEIERQRVDDLKSESIELEGKAAQISCPPLLVSASSTVPLLQRYVDDARGYSIDYPSNWVHETSYSDGRGSFWPILRPFDAEWMFDPINRIIVTTRAIQPMRDKCQSLDSCLAETLQYTTDAHCFSLKLGNVDARLIEYRRGEGHTIELFTLREKDIYSVTADFDSPDVWERYEDVIRSIIHSFTFLQ